VGCQAIVPYEKLMMKIRETRSESHAAGSLLYSFAAAKKDAII